MADIGGSEKEVDKGPSPDGTIYRFESAYTEEEKLRLRRFMHADFPHIMYGGGRYQDVIIENPPEQICSPKEWKEVLDMVFIPEWESMDLELKRTKKIIVRFVDSLYDKEIGEWAGGCIIEQDNEKWCRINYKFKNRKNVPIEELTYILMHELAEADFWAKTLSGDEEAAKIKDDANIFKNDNQGYRHLLDEKIANRRALRAVRRMWPEASWTDPEDEYEEDKEEEEVTS